MGIASFVRPYGFALIALLTCTSACSKHTDNDDDDERDEDAGPGDAGRGGAGSGAGGAGGTPTAPVVRCGNTQCPAPVNLLATLGIPGAVACCIDTTCGIAATAGAMCEPPARPDTRCPGIDLSALGMFAGGAAPSGEMGGCCIDNECGLDGALFGRGCVENGEAKSMLSTIPFVGNLINVPAARACDAPPDLDAGTGDDAG